MANIVYWHLFLREGSKKTKVPKLDGHIDYCHLCLRKESKKTKGPKQDGQNRLLSPMPERGEISFNNNYMN